MALVGLLISFVGFLIAAASIGVVSDNSTRLVVVLVGIAVSLFGIFSVNQAYLKNAIWKR